MISWPCLFAELAEEQRIPLLDRHRETSHQVDQVIVMEQDHESLFLIREGWPRCALTPQTVMK